MASIKIDSRWGCWFIEVVKALGYDFKKTADPFSTKYPFWIWNIDLRSGVDEFFAMKEKNEFCFVFLAACSELAMNKLAV